MQRVRRQEKLQAQDHCVQLPVLVREALHETVMSAGLACVSEVLEAERSELCGVRYQHIG